MCRRLHRRRHTATTAARQNTSTCRTGLWLRRVVVARRLRRLRRMRHTGLAIVAGTRPGAARVGPEAAQRRLAPVAEWVVKMRQGWVEFAGLLWPETRGPGASRLDRKNTTGPFLRLGTSSGPRRPETTRRQTGRRPDLRPAPAESGPRRVVSVAQQSAEIARLHPPTGRPGRFVRVLPTHWYRAGKNTSHRFLRLAASSGPGHRERGVYRRHWGWLAASPGHRSSAMRQTARPSSSSGRNYPEIEACLLQR